MVADDVDVASSGAPVPETAFVFVFDEVLDVFVRRAERPGERLLLWVKVCTHVLPEGSVGRLTDYVLKRFDLREAAYKFHYFCKDLEICTCRTKLKLTEDVGGRREDISPKSSSK